MELKENLPDYIEVADKIYEIVKGENYKKVESAFYYLLKELKNKSIIN